MNKDDLLQAASRAAAHHQKKAEKLQYDKLRLELQLKSLLEVVSDELKKHRLESEKQDSLNLLRELHNERMAE